MKNKSSSAQQSYCMCALDGTMDLLGRKWVLFVINSIGNNGTVRFTLLNKELNGISPSTLSWILRKLEQSNTVKRQPFAEIPPRVEYSLTENGKNLWQAIMPLLAWAAKQDGYQKKIRNCNPKQFIRVNLK